MALIMDTSGGCTKLKTPKLDKKQFDLAYYYNDYNIKVFNALVIVPTRLGSSINVQSIVLVGLAKFGRNLLGRILFKRPSFGRP